MYSQSNNSFNINNDFVLFRCVQAKQIAQPYDYNAYKKKQTAKKNEPKSRIVVDKVSYFPISVTVNS